MLLMFRTRPVWASGLVIVKPAQLDSIDARIGGTDNRAAMYLDDPSPLIAPLEAAWAKYVSNCQDWYEAAQSSVVEWKYSPDHQYVPRHPFWRAFDVGDHSSWRARPVRFVDADAGVQGCPHGFDKDGRIVLAGNRLIVYGDGSHDILIWSHLRDPQTREPTGEIRVYEPHIRSGFPKGGFDRIVTQPSGRIMQSIGYANHGEEPDLQFRSVETFCWEGDWLTESYRQSFNLATGLIERHRELTPDQLSLVDRKINDHLREAMASRGRIVYSYDARGTLSKVAEFDDDRRSKAVWYTYNPADTIEKLSAKLTKLVVKQAVKAIKATKDARPVRYVALQYSAEHAHCGLPTEVLLASAEDETQPFDWESYPHQAEWPPTGRAGRTWEDLMRRLEVVVEASPEYAEDYQPRPYREVLWRASRLIYAALARKRLTTDDFAVFPLDDHGDVDPREDARESLPSQVAAAVILQAGAD